MFTFTTLFFVVEPDRIVWSVSFRDHEKRHDGIKQHISCVSVTSLGNRSMVIDRLSGLDDSWIKAAGSSQLLDVVKPSDMRGHPRPKGF